MKLTLNKRSETSIEREGTTHDAMSVLDGHVTKFYIFQTSDGEWHGTTNKYRYIEMYGGVLPDVNPPVIGPFHSKEITLAALNFLP